MLMVMALVTVVAGPAAVASGQSRVIVLPGATSAEGIARGQGSTFFAGDLFAGDIFRGDVGRGTAELFIDAPAGRMAAGMKVDRAHGLLFVAGGGGHIYIYNIRTGVTVADFAVGDPATSFVNDVALTPSGAWFTESLQPKLYFVPISRHGALGPVRELTVTGPASTHSGGFDLNGIQVPPDGKTLIVGHSANNQVYTIDPVTGASTAIAGLNLTGPDGLVLEGRRLWVVGDNRVTRTRLSVDLTSAVVEKVITSDLFQTPSTAALFGDRLAVVNAKFDTGVPPTADQYEVIFVKA
jgi:sugar lactone lactonase YvrE